MFIEWHLKGPFSTNVHLPMVSVATEDSSDSVVEFPHAAVTTKSLCGI